VDTREGTIKRDFEGSAYASVVWTEIIFIKTYSYKHVHRPQYSIKYDVYLDLSEP
jgi:hypothetical protein